MLVALLTTTVMLAAATVAAGYVLGHPYKRSVGAPPTDLPIEQVRFPSESGSTIHGWLAPAAPDRGVVILMHGIRATRCSMVDRARFLHQAGYSVLLFDFQAHGESRGKVITFGYLESRDARAAVQFVRARLPGQRIAVIGSSLGGAASLLGDLPLEVDALVLEAVYPTIAEAVANRLEIGFGPAGGWFAPLLTWQLRPRLGISAARLQPIARIDGVSCPVFIINGVADRYTTPAQAMALFDRARSPKFLWLVPGAGHINLDRFADSEYQRRILQFLDDHLAARS